MAPPDIDVLMMNPEDFMSEKDFPPLHGSESYWIRYDATEEEKAKHEADVRRTNQNYQNWHSGLQEGVLVAIRTHRYNRDAPNYTIERITHNTAKFFTVGFAKYNKDHMCPVGQRYGGRAVPVTKELVVEIQRYIAKKALETKLEAVIKNINTLTPEQVNTLSLSLGLVPFARKAT